MLRTSLIALTLASLAGVAWAQTKSPYTADEMQALLGKGLTVTGSNLPGGAVFTSNVTLAPGGKLTGSITSPGQEPIGLNGSWILNGAQVCRTLNSESPVMVCETWLKSGPKEATVVVNNKEAAINRWK
jgi:hypothetical protein